MPSVPIPTLTALSSIASEVAETVFLDGFSVLFTGYDTSNDGRTGWGRSRRNAIDGLRSAPGGEFDGRSPGRVGRTVSVTGRISERHRWRGYSNPSTQQHRAYTHSRRGLSPAHLSRDAPRPSPGRIRLRFLPDATSAVGEIRSRLAALYNPVCAADSRSPRSRVAFLCSLFTRGLAANDSCEHNGRIELISCGRVASSHAIARRRFTVHTVVSLYYQPVWLWCALMPAVLLMEKRYYVYSRRSGQRVPCRS